jgi:mannosyltransferase
MVLLLGLGVRLIGIASRPLWYDEAFSVLFSEKGPAAMLVGTLSSTASGAAEEHPLAYYTLLWAWMHTFGESLVAIRAFSIIAGLAAVLLAYVFARDLTNGATALIAGVIAALSPFQLHYSQEVRMYIFLGLWLLLATYAYWRASQLTGWKWWGAFAVFAALAQYTHNLAAFYLIALALWPLITRDWRLLRGIVLSGLAALVLYLPWLIHLPAQFAKVGQTYWIEQPGLYRILTLVLVFVTNLPLPNGFLAAGLFLALAVVMIALWQTGRAVHRKQSNSRTGLWLLYLSFVPAILLFLFSQWKPIYLERALLPSGMIFCIWVAWTLTETQLARPVQYFVAALLAMAFALGIYEHVTYTGFPYGPYNEITANLHSRLQPGDVVIHSSKLSMLPSFYYDRLLPQTYVADPPGSREDTLAHSTQLVLGLEAQPNLESAVGNARRVWFVIFETSNEEYKQAGYPRHPQLTWLMQHYSQVEVRDWGDLRVYAFVKAP